MRLTLEVLMRFKVFSAVTALAILASTTLHANSENVHPSRSEAEREVIAAQEAQITANNAADIAALDQLTAEEYVGVDASGTMYTKDEFLREVEKRGPAAVRATPQQMRERQREWRVRIFGDVGVVTRLTAGDHGSPSWVTAIWVKRDGRWLRVFGQVTTAAAK
jgi:ketosteroid isomerase-like protein